MLKWQGPRQTEDLVHISLACSRAISSLGCSRSWAKGGASTQEIVGLGTKKQHMLEVLFQSCSHPVHAHSSVQATHRAWPETRAACKPSPQVGATNSLNLNVIYTLPFLFSQHSGVLGQEGGKAERETPGL